MRHVSRVPPDPIVNNQTMQEKKEAEAWNASAV